MDAEGQITTGPLWAGRNWAADAGEGSIHDDDTATELGFRGGTVPGDVHMNQFPATLVRVFGDSWLARGHLSLDFRNATTDGENVRVLVSEPRGDLARVWMEREDGLLVCEGTAGLNNLDRAHLQSKDLRACDPSELRILRRVSAGTCLGEYRMVADSAKQFARYDAGLLSDPLPVYRQPGADWSGVLACPSTFVQYLWGPPMDGLRPLVDDAVGLFGAIEIATFDGPFLLDEQYDFASFVVSVGQSPKTEFLWYDTTASRQGRKVAHMRMQLRFMKASSPAYQ